MNKMNLVAAIVLTFYAIPSFSQTCQPQIVPSEISAANRDLLNETLAERSFVTGDIDPALLALDKKVREFSKIQVTGKASPNPYRNMATPKLTGLALLEFIKIVGLCGSGVVGAAGVELLALIPLVGGISTENFGDVAPDLKNNPDNFPMHAGGVGVIVIETAGAAFRTVCTGVMCSVEYLKDGKVTEKITKDNFYNYDGTWAILTSFTGSLKSFTAPTSACGQSISRFSQIVGAHNKTFQ